MTSPLSTVARQYRFNEGLLGAATDGFDEAVWSRRPDGGGNSAHWIVGHLAVSRRHVLRMAGAEIESDPWEKEFGKGATPGARVETPVEVLVAAFRSAGDAITEHVGALSDEAAAAPSPHQFPDGSKTVGDAIRFMHFHESYHLGQVAMLRRLAGLPGFV